MSDFNTNVSIQNDVSSYLFNRLIHHAVKDKLQIKRFADFTYCKFVGDKNLLIEKVTALGGNLIQNTNGAVNEIALHQDVSLTFSFHGDNAYCSFSNNGISFSSVNHELFNSLMEVYKEFYSTKKELNNIYCILSNREGLFLSPLKNHDIELEEDNYNSEVIASYKYVVKELNGEKPKGRIAVLLGEPGTGKTYLIRTMIKDLTNCICIMVPPNMVQSLDKPELLELLIEKKFKQPIVFIIEDGDVCLSARKSDNISTISSLLNLGDGILGSLLDVRFVITSNASIAELDPAIMRPCRLCKKIEVDLLAYEKANSVYQRLKDDKTTSLEPKKFYSLAEIYSLAFNDPQELEIKTSDKKKIGFLP